MFCLLSEGEPQSLIKAIKYRRLFCGERKVLTLMRFLQFFFGDNQTLEIYRMSIGTDSKLGVVVWFSYLMGWREIY